MFKGLKRRFLLSNMLLTLAVLLGALAMIFSSAYLSARSDVKTKLLALPKIYNEGVAVPTPSAGHVLTYLADIEMSEQKTEKADFFVILVNGDGEISDNDAAHGVMENDWQIVKSSATPDGRWPQKVFSKTSICEALG